MGEHKRKPRNYHGGTRTNGTIHSTASGTDGRGDTNTDNTADRKKQYTEGRHKSDSRKLQVSMRRRTTKRTNRTEQNKENSEKQATQTTQLRKRIGEDGNQHVDINDNPMKRTRLNQENETEQKKRAGKEGEGKPRKETEEHRDNTQEPVTQN